MERHSAGHGDSSGSFEYLVFRGILEGVAKEHGFTPIVDLQDPKLDRLFQEVGIFSIHHPHQCAVISTVQGEQYIVRKRG